MDRIGGDERAFQIQQREQRAGGDHLVAALGHRLLADDKLSLGRKRGHDMQRTGACRTVEGPAQGLAVDGHHPRTAFAKGIQEVAKAARQRIRIDQAKQPRERVMAG